MCTDAESDGLMTDHDFRIDLFGELTSQQRRELASRGSGVLYRQVRPAEAVRWMQLPEHAHDATGPTVQRTVGGCTVGDDRQDGDAVAELVTLIWYDVPTAEVEEFEDWFAQEHAPILMREPNWLRCRRVRVTENSEGASATHLVIHELADGTALSSPHIEAARATPARADMAARPWFAANVMELFERETPVGAIS